MPSLKHISRKLNEVSLVKIKKRTRLFVIEVLICNPSQSVNLKLATTYQGMSVADKNTYSSGFDSSLSSTFSIKSDYHSNHSGGDIICMDTLRIGNLTITDFPILLPPDSYYSLFSYQGLLGLGYAQKDISVNNHKVTFDFFDDFLYKNANTKRIIGLKAIIMMKVYDIRRSASLY